MMMRTIHRCYLFVGIGLSLAVSDHALASKASYPTYEAAKADFFQPKNIQAKNFDQAKKWFHKAGYGTEFETYFEARDFFEAKGYIKVVNKLYDGSGMFSFAREGESVDKSAFHDVMVALYLSDFVYCLGKLRAATKSLSFTDEELEAEVVCGDSFEGVSKKPMVQLLQGNLKVSKDPDKRTPEVNIAQLQDVLRYEGFQGVSKRFANELTVTALNSAKTNKLFIHKFDAKYHKKNLVYCIAKRERKNGENPDAKESDMFLTFRGSSTLRDWIQNVQAPLVTILLRHDKVSGRCFLVEQLTYQKIEIEKDLYDQFEKIVQESGNEIQVHKGFLEYLFADRGRDGTKDDDKDNDSMFTNIRLNVVRLLDQKFTVTNSLIVTGHSLGGALATLGSFFLACDKGINNRGPDWEGVKCISFASPLVGNVSFQRAYEILQSKQQYQSTTAKNKGERLFKNIRITNNRDVVPMVPMFSKYRHTSGIHVHLKRPNILSLWKHQKPKIKVHEAHWKRELFELFNRKKLWENRKKPWKYFHPISMIAGWFATTSKFINLVTTTIPIIYLVPYLLIKPFLTLFPPKKQFVVAFRIMGILGGVGAVFQNFWVKKLLWAGSWYVMYHFLATKESSTLERFAVVGGVGVFLRNFTVQRGLLGVSWTVMYHFLTKKKSSTLERFAVVGIGAPTVLGLTRLIRNKSYYKLFANYWQVYFLVGIAFAQIAAFMIRSPVECLTFKTHGLQKYFYHIRPNHPLLSSSKAIIDSVEVDMMD